jgi:hypothetical protein
MILILFEIHFDLLWRVGTVMEATRTEVAIPEKKVSRDLIECEFVLYCLFGQMSINVRLEFGVLLLQSLIAFTQFRRSALSVAMVSFCEKEEPSHRETSVAMIPTTGPTAVFTKPAYFLSVGSVMMGLI